MSTRNKTLGNPQIDLFASKTNKKCSTYCSWKPDKEALAIDAFTISCNKMFFYAFPPFCLILRTLQKIEEDEGEGIVVVPHWPSQPWFPLFLALLCAPPLVLSPSNNLLSSIYRTPHPLHQSLSLVVGKLSGKY